MHKLTVREGASATNSEWDQFLKQTKYGHFEQCSGWAAAKATEGWRCSRIEIVEGNRIIGGFQILFRTKGFVRIGYISKGPAIICENDTVQSFVIEQIKSQAAKKHLWALLVHPPELCCAMSPILAQKGFLPNRLQRLSEANLLIDTACGKEKIEERMSRFMRHKVRQSVKRGVSIREGDASDLPVFFELMLKSCERQGNIKPVPGSVSFFQELCKHVTLRLTFAEIGEEAVSGLLSIPFGDRVTFFKKGWNSQHSDRHPNSLLFHEALEWAGDQGYKACDFTALDQNIAKALLSGNDLPDGYEKSRHCFDLSFGGTPIIFPDSLVWFPNAVIRKMYNLLLSLKK
jgi:hypothetical protein